MELIEIRSNIEKGKERLIQLIKPCRNPTKPFDFLEKAFNEVVFFVQTVIYWPRLFRVVFWRDYNDCSMLLDIRKDVLGAIGFIAEQVAACDICPAHHFNCMSRIVAIARRQQKGNGVP